MQITSSSTVSSSSISSRHHSCRSCPVVAPRVQPSCHRQPQPLLTRPSSTANSSSSTLSSSGSSVPQLPSIPNSWVGAHSGAESAADASKAAKYKRIMLKVSGEALQGDKGFGLDPAVVEAIAREIKAARQHGIEVAVVVGGGNYFRGASAWKGLERATADYVGMLATVMNALCLQVGQGWGSLATTSQLSPVHACTCLYMPVHLLSLFQLYNQPCLGADPTTVLGNRRAVCLYCPVSPQPQPSACEAS